MARTPQSKKIFEHRCTDCGAVSDHWVYYEDKIQVCPECGGDANRIISAVPWGNENALGVDPNNGFSGAAMKWEKDTIRRHQRAGQAHHKRPPEE